MWFQISFVNDCQLVNINDSKIGGGTYQIWLTILRLELWYHEVSIESN